MVNDHRAKEKRLLKKHHWGSKSIPIKNIVAMIHHRPNEKFNFVAIKTLNELNGYINHFDAIFDAIEVRRIANHLIRKNNQE